MGVESSSFRLRSESVGMGVLGTESFGTFLAGVVKAEAAIGGGGGGGGGDGFEGMGLLTGILGLGCEGRGFWRVVGEIYRLRGGAQL